jgi:hypothetical protein
LDTWYYITLLLLRERFHVLKNNGTYIVLALLIFYFFTISQLTSKQLNIMGFSQYIIPVLDYNDLLVLPLYYLCLCLSFVFVIVYGRFTWKRICVCFILLVYIWIVIENLNIKRGLKSTLPHNTGLGYNFQSHGHFYFQWC